MELIKALEIVIEYLDAKMEDSPDRQLADISNYLEDIKAGLSE